MKIKNFKKEVSNASFEIPDVYKQIEDEVYQKEYTVTSLRPKTFSLYKTMLTFVPMLTVIVITLFLSFSLLPSERDLLGEIDEVKYADDLGLYTVKSESNLKKILYKNGLRENNVSRKTVFSSFVSSFAKQDTIMQGNISYNESSPNNTSDTNVQVAGVDEADIVKHDGKYIYLVANGTFYVIELENENTKKIYEQKISSSDSEVIFYSSIYVHNNYVVLLHTKYNSVNVTIYNKDILVDELVSEKKMQSYSVDGYLSDSRLLEKNNTLYLVSYRQVFSGNSYYYVEGETEITLPTIKVNDQEKDIDFDDVKYCPEANNSSYVIISSIHLNDEVSFNEKITLGNISYDGSVYSSEYALYISSMQYIYDINAYKTCIIKYLYSEDGSVTYNGFAYLDGYILNQYSIDEYDGYLRVATTHAFNQSSTELNRLYVLKPEFVDDSYVLKKVGSIEENLGKPYETIKSVRFNQDIAYVVTFRNTDPLYAIDLKDPTNPQITYAYETPGYSSYLHLIPKTNYALGLGQDDDPSFYKLSLYLVKTADGEDLICEVDNYLIPKYKDGFQSIEAVNNPKAIYANLDNGIFYFGFAVENQAESVSYYLYSFDVENLNNIASDIISKLDTLPEGKEISTFYPDLYNMQINKLSSSSNGQSRLIHAASSEYFYFVTTKEVITYVYNDGEFTKENEINYTK